MKTKTFLLASSLTLLTGSIFAQQPMTIQVSTINPSCNGYWDGTIALTITGGSSPYSVDGIPIAGDTYLAEYVAAGEYDLSVMDTNLDSVQVNVTLVEPAPIVVQAIISHVTGYGLADGAIDLETEVPCSYYWGAINGSAVSTSSQDQINLRPDIFETIVTELSTGCTTRRSFEITEPSAPVLPGFNPDKLEFLSNENLYNALTVYPNPSSGNITIKAIREKGDAYIVDQMGVIVHRLKLDRETIQSLDLEQGVYTVVYTDINGGSFEERIIIR
jgi:hypothetical protein